jgi:hypothetical protein
MFILPDTVVGVAGDGMNPDVITEEFAGALLKL